MGVGGSRANGSREVALGPSFSHAMHPDTSYGNVAESRSRNPYCQRASPNSTSVIRSSPLTDTITSNQMISLTATHKMRPKLPQRPAPLSDILQTSALIVYHNRPKARTKRAPVHNKGFNSGNDYGSRCITRASTLGTTMGM